MNEEMKTTEIGELPVPPAGDVPEYFVAACDKFDWAPEEALRFYAEGKHFDTVDGRTRILCTGAIASHALKGLAGPYADMKGIEPAGDVEVLGVTHRWFIDQWYAQSADQAGWHVDVKGLSKDTLADIELVDRAHVTRLQAEVADLIEARGSRVAERLAVLDELSSERDALRTENESFRKNYVTKLAYSALQSELTKARELLVTGRSVVRGSEYKVNGGIAWLYGVENFLAHQSAPVASLIERGSTHGFEQSPNTCRHDEKSGVWWREGNVTRTGRECNACGHLDENAPVAKGEE